MTELQALNRVLVAINQAPVTATGSGVNVLVNAAEDILAESKKEIQAEGWWYNTECDVSISESGGAITLPTTALSADATDPSKNYVKRGTTLYDLDNHTATWATGVSVKLTIVYDLAWTDMPDLVASYVAAKAASRLAETYDRDPALVRSLRSREAELRIRMLSEDEKQSDANLLVDDPNLAAASQYGGRGPIERGWVQ